MIRSTLPRLSTALKVISLRLPIGVGTRKSLLIYREFEFYKIKKLVDGFTFRFFTSIAHDYCHRILETFSFVKPGNCMCICIFVAIEYCTYKEKLVTDTYCFR